MKRQVSSARFPRYVSFRSGEYSACIVNNARGRVVIIIIIIIIVVRAAASLWRSGGRVRLKK